MKAFNSNKSRLADRLIKNQVLLDLSDMPSDMTQLHASSRGFSLIELLVVMAIAGLLTALSLPAFNAILSASGTTSALSEIANTLQQARAFAMAGNTYVFVGFAEVDATNSVAAANQPPGIGRLAMAVTASKDGSFTPLSWNSSKLLSLNKVKIFNNVHLSGSIWTPPASGAMVRPAVDSTYSIGTISQTATGFSWPLEAANANYTFNKVICFDPQGVAWIQFSTTSRDDVPPYIELDIQPTHGNNGGVVPATPTDFSTGKQAAIQLDCITGAVRTYRP